MHITCSAIATAELGMKLKMARTRPRRQSAMGFEIPFSIAKSPVYQELNCSSLR